MTEKISDFRKRFEEIRKIPIELKFSQEEQNIRLERWKANRQESMFSKSPLPSNISSINCPERKGLPVRSATRYLGLNCEFYRNSIALAGRQQISGQNSAPNNPDRQQEEKPQEEVPQNKKVSQEEQNKQPVVSAGIFGTGNLFKLQPVQNSYQDKSTQEVSQTQNLTQKTSLTSLFDNRPLGNLFNQNNLLEQKVQQPQTNIPVPTKEMLENPSKLFDNKQINKEKEQVQPDKKPGMSLFGGNFTSNFNSAPSMFSTNKSQPLVKTGEQPENVPKTESIFDFPVSEKNKPESGSAPINHNLLYLPGQETIPSTLNEPKQESESIYIPKQNLFSGISFFPDKKKPISQPSLFGTSKEVPQQKTEQQIEKPRAPTINLFGSSSGSGLFGSASTGGIFASQGVSSTIEIKKPLFFTQNNQEQAANNGVEQEQSSKDTGIHLVPASQQKVVNIFEHKSQDSEDKDKSFSEPHLETKSDLQVQQDINTQKQGHQLHQHSKIPKIPSFESKPEEKQQKIIEKAEQKVLSPQKMAIGPGGKKIELPDNSFFSANSNKPNIFTGATNLFGNSSSGSLFGGNKTTSQPQSTSQSQNTASQPSLFSQQYSQKALTGGIFANNSNSIFGQGNSGSIFSGGSGNQSGTVFGSNLQNTLFKQQNNQNEDEESGDDGPIEAEDEADPTKSSGHYEYTKNTIIFKQQAPKLRQGKKQILEGVTVSLQKFEGSESVFFIVRMANKCIAFTAKVIPKVTQIRVLNNVAKNLELTKLMIQGGNNELILVRVQFKDEETGKRFLDEVQSIVKIE